MIFLLKYWKYIAVAIIMAILVRGIYHAGGEAPRAELQHIRQMQALQAGHDLKNKERTDAEVTRRTAAVDRQLTGLRQRAVERPLVPDAPAGDPDLATFSRSELDRALRDFEGEVEAIVGEGAKAAEAIDALKR